ncbi:divergent PAP2 family protein [Haloplasma contractile]|uniref:Integral membrane protein n=1 Tax=Haloplasma contractile SSD-17B TaxID=1033810 RepID=U2EEG8_9MOLU|nr:divergent PAP2 family protein [Haloplasma contractile]ERJ13373.1 Integral membrane protein [Haloplasma contractile SSD-17B]
MFFNAPLITSIVAMLLAQFVKFPLNYFINKEWRPSILISTGGMPSSHSAFVTALTISIGIIEGISTTSFAISFVLAGVVIHDAMGIRREAGKHATVLNQMAQDLNYLVTNGIKRQFNDRYDEKFKELLGHEPSETFAGIIFGIIVTVLFKVYVY